MVTRVVYAIGMHRLEERITLTGYVAIHVETGIIQTVKLMILLLLLHTHANDAIESVGTLSTLKWLFL